MPLHKLDTQAIIIGAGPAGAGISFFLSKYQVPHVVIDKAVFPRDKVCGDACSGKTALVIGRANPEWLDEIRQQPGAYLPFWGLTFVAPNGKKLDIPFSANPTGETKLKGFNVPRKQFDDFLFRKMTSPYCTILQGTRVDAIGRAGGGVQVVATYGDDTYEIAAPVIAGADGDKSIVRRQFMTGNAVAKTEAIGLRGYYSGITGMHPDNYIELHFLPEILPGYLWIFPLANGRANVGVGMLSEKVREKKINLRAQMLAAIKNNPQIAPRFANAILEDKIQGWGLPLAVRQDPLSGNNFLLTGDAGGLIDPFSGEGIGNALYSGMLAADAIRNGIEKGDFSAASLKLGYDDVLYKRLGRELALSTKMQRIGQYPWIFNMVVNKAYKSPMLRHSISSMFLDMDLRAQLSKPSFYLKILFNR